MLPFTTHTIYNEDWLNGFSVATDRILAFSIDLFRRHYNTLVLPC